LELGYYLRQTSYWFSQISGNYGVAKDVLVDIASDSEQELCMMKMLEQNLSVLDLSRALGWHTTCQE
jgi:hypothetical protein